MDLLCETALLTHGLYSVSQEELRAAWPFQDNFLVWVDSGRIVRGTMADYLPFRERNAEVCRIDCNTLDRALHGGVSGALTASGTMAVCEKLGVPLAVTCGMGGIGEIRGEELCPDLPALTRRRAALLATSPKDMLDIPGTINWLRDHGVHVAGPACTGYVFHRPPVEVELSSSACKTADAVRRLTADGGLLMLNPIPSAERVQRLSILAAAIAAGRQAEQSGRYYHPAANREIDQLTGGESSRMQLRSLIANLRLAIGIL